MARMKRLSAGQSKFGCETLWKLNHPSCYGLLATLQSFKSLRNSGSLPFAHPF
jgi:hypothetical protein